MKRTFRIIGVVIGLLLAVGLTGAGIVYARSNARLATTYEVPTMAGIELPTDAESLTEGERLYVTRGCVECHTQDASGQVFIDDPAVGRVIASNLTRGEGGLDSDYDSSDWLRALRHGIDSDGTGYYVMPAHHFNHYSDADMGRIIAYVESLEPVDNVLPDHRPGPLARVFLTTPTTEGFLPAVLVDHENIDVWNDVEATVSEEYGHYLVRGGCLGCHTENLSGGGIPGEAIPASNITFHEEGLTGWTLEEFATAMRNGMRPDGSVIDPTMPWYLYSRMTDEEIEAMYVYLQSVEPLAYGTELTEENSVLNR